MVRSTRSLSAMQGYNDCLQRLKVSLITATASIVIISTFVMAVTANLPIVVAPGLGALPT